MRMYVTLDGVPYTATFQHTREGFSLVSLLNAETDTYVLDISEETRVFFEDAAYAAYVNMLDEKKSEYVN